MLLPRGIVSDFDSKKPVICTKEAPGFIANRLQIALEREAFHMVQRGIATAQDVDNALKYSFGRRMGVAGPLKSLSIMRDMI